MYGEVWIGVIVAKPRDFYVGVELPDGDYSNLPVALAAPLDPSPANLTPEDVVEGGTLTLYTA